MWSRAEARPTPNRFARSWAENLQRDIDAANFIVGATNLSLATRTQSLQERVARVEAASSGRSRNSVMTVPQQTRSVRGIQRDRLCRHRRRGGRSIERNGVRGAWKHSVASGDRQRAVLFQVQLVQKLAPFAVLFLCGSGQAQRAPLTSTTCGATSDLKESESSLST